MKQDGGRDGGISRRRQLDGVHPLARNALIASTFIDAIDQRFRDRSAGRRRAGGGPRPLINNPFRWRPPFGLIGDDDTNDLRDSSRTSPIASRPGRRTPPRHTGIGEGFVRADQAILQNVF
jgi:hypothetical protein